MYHFLCHGEGGHPIIQFAPAEGRVAENYKLDAAVCGVPFTTGCELGIFLPELAGSRE